MLNLELNIELVIRGGGVLPYMGYIGMVWYGISDVLFINRVSILAILIAIWVRFQEEATF